MAGIFDSPQIRELIKDTSFDGALNPAKLSAWLPLPPVIANFLGSRSSSQHQNVVDELMENFHQISMSVKMHFLRSHLDYFPENCGDFSEEHGECFQQDISDMTKRYQGQWDVNFLANNCWCLNRDMESAQHKQKTLKRPLIYNYSKYFVCHRE